MTTNPLPSNIPEYLEHLRRSLAGADPALIQDALYDAEEYLRSEMSENPGMTEAAQNAMTITASSPMMMPVLGSPSAV